MESKRTILVVDDASLVRLYYRTTLESADFQVEEALNGLEALEKLLTIEVHLLIVDINMPKMDGLTFLQAVRRRDRALAAIPALVTSTEAAEEDFEAARVAGANYYLVKPIDQAKLRQFVKMLAGVPQ